MSKLLIGTKGASPTRGKRVGGSKSIRSKATPILQWAGNTSASELQETDEPLLEQSPRYLFKQFGAAQVHLDQIVIGTEV